MATTEGVLDTVCEKLEEAAFRLRRQSGTPEGAADQQMLEDLAAQVEDLSATVANVLELPAPKKGK